MKSWPNAGAAMAGAADPSRARLPAASPGGASAASRWLRLRPPRIARALTLLALLAHVALWGLTAPWGRSVVGGMALVAAGLGWMLWAWWCFRRADTPIRPTAMPTQLVDHGPFAFGRNPMYLGMTVALLGIGVALGVPFMTVAAALFVLIVQRVHIPHEEAQLQSAFGGWYSDYAATVRRWF